jgi:hypothetical protein
MNNQKLSVDTKTEHFYCNINSVEVEAEILTIEYGDYEEFEVIKMYEGNTSITDDMILKEFEIYKETQTNEFETLNTL